MLALSVLNFLVFVTIQEMSIRTLIDRHTHAFPETMNLPICGVVFFRSKCLDVWHLRNGDVYVGEFRRTSLDGTGTLYWSTGEVYRGTWKHQFVLEGNADVTYVNGDHFKGEYSGGKKNGPGVYTWKDGSRFVGEWKDGRPAVGLHRNAQEHVIRGGTYKDMGLYNFGEIIRADIVVYSAD